MWYQAWLDTLAAVLVEIRAHIPAVAGAVALVVLGWVLARLARRWTRALIIRLLESVGSLATVAHAIDGSGARVSAPKLVAGFAYWGILLVFVAAAVEALGLPVMTDLVARFASYLPNLLAAGLVLLGGLVAAQLVRAAVARAAETANLPQAAGIATVAHAMVIVLAAVIALEQLGVNGRVLELTIGVVVGSSMAAIALAFGLGARSSVANLIAGHYVARMLQVGQLVRIDGVQGTVVELTPIAVIVDGEEGRVVIPADRFHVACTVWPRAGG